MDFPYASFILRHTDLPGFISTGINNTNSVGYASDYKNTATWTNLDLRGILGEMYDNYNMFNLVLTNVCWKGSAGNTGTNGEDWNNMIYMNGLNWINQTYDTSQKNNTNFALIGNFSYANNSSGGIKGLIDYSPCTFVKSTGPINLTINIVNNVSGDVPIMTGGTRDWYLQFTFDIYGIKDDELSCSNNPVQSNSFLNI